jgi:hypothetical protein
MKKVVAENDCHTKHLYPGDAISCVWEDEGGKEVVVTKEIKEYIEVDRAVIFYFEEEFGMKKGYGGAFGQK